MLREFVDAWDRCNSDGGCYPCTPKHYYLCPAVSDDPIKRGSCDCGREELERAREQLKFLPTGQEGKL